MREAVAVGVDEGGDGGGADVGEEGQVVPGAGFGVWHGVEGVVVGGVGDFVFGEVGVIEGVEEAVGVEVWG